MDSQNDVTTGFSQNMAKRSRSSSRSSSKRSRGSSRSLTTSSRTSNVSRNWPYAKKGMSLTWDPFPAKARALMRYSQVISLTPGTGVPAPYLFRANGIQDPDYSGVGHQPYGHDTYASIYNHYNVRSATITMTPVGDFTDQIFGISLCDDSTVQSDYDTIRETKGTRLANCLSGGKAPSVQNYFNVNQNFDLPFQKATSASFGANPSESMIFHCWSEGKSITDSSGTNQYMISITYVVDMWELKDLGQS